MKAFAVLLLVALASLACADVVRRNGGRVVGVTCANDALQAWTFDNKTNTFYIARNGGKYCMDLVQSATRNGANVKTYLCDPTKVKSQVWKYEPSSGRIANAASGRCLTLMYMHGEPFSNVVVSDCIPASGNLPYASQQFDLVASAGGYHLVSRMGGVCLKFQLPAEVSTDQSTSSPVIIGHRGSCYDAPENTLPAFQMALDDGADGIELDLRVTKDNVVVIIHDETADRTSNCRGAIRQMTYAELSKCDFGTWFDKSFAGTKIPTFEECVKLASARNAYMVLDLKELPTDAEEQIRANEMRRVLEAYDYHALAIASCRNEKQIQWFDWLLNGTVLQHLQNQPSPKTYESRDYWKRQIMLHKNGYSLQLKTSPPTSCARHTTA